MAKEEQNAPAQFLSTHPAVRIACNADQESELTATPEQESYGKDPDMVSPR